MNSNDPPASLPPAEPRQSLPELNTKLLTDDEVTQLLRDIELCAQITEIIPKFVARGHVPDTGGITLEEARQLLSTRALRGLQIRYRYENADWWDTLMLVQNQFRLVRIRHDFSTETTPSADP